MRKTAEKANLPDARYYGGLLHDEAKIQQDLIINCKGKTNQLNGWVDTGDECQNLKIIKDNQIQKKLAIDVLQITFLGHTGFRFPIVHYTIVGVKASEHYVIIWNVISGLQSWGFKVDFVMQDGGQQNREFTRLHFKDEHKVHKFQTESFVSPAEKVGFCQDFSHNMKKLRNATCILSSGNQPFHTRLLTKNGQYIVWDPWLHAANWDEKTNSRLIHHKLTSSHLRPDSSEKMRNHLAEDVLDENMLNLMKQYQMSLINGTELDSTIEFLENASKMVKFFRDARPVVSMSDVRVNEIKSVLHWFQGWMAEIPVSNVSTKQRGKMLPSQKCLDDV